MQLTRARRFFFLLCSSFLVLLLAACGSTGSNSSTTPTPTGNTPTVNASVTTGTTQPGNRSDHSSHSPYFDQLSC